MLTFCFMVLAAVCAGPLTEGTNIMLGKPTQQSSTLVDIHTQHEYPPEGANDGDTAVESWTATEMNPYWQGDLRGFYTVHSLSVTSPQNNENYLWDAFISVAVHDINKCTESELIECGRWSREFLALHTAVFNCSHAGPVRFVRIWVPWDGRIGLSEVRVEGDPTELQGAIYDRHMDMKFTTWTVAVLCFNAAECVNMCHRSQPCLGFSVSKAETPECILAMESGRTEKNVEWNSYAIRKCFTLPTCNVSETI